MSEISLPPSNYYNIPTLSYQFVEQRYPQDTPTFLRLINKDSYTPYTNLSLEQAYALADAINNYRNMREINGQS